MQLRLAPALFVFLWSTGFIGSKLGAADAEPFTFLALRFVLALLLLLPVALWRNALCDGWRKRGHAALAGALIHGGYLGGVFWAIKHGMPAGVVALIVSLQPILTSVLAGPLLGEKLAARHWVGLALGLAGGLLIVGPKLGVAGVGAATLAASLTSLLAITLGTLYQKRHGSGMDLVGGTVWQYVGAVAVVGSAAMLFETRTIVWTPKFIFALAWLVLALSIGAILLLMLLIRQHAVSGVSGLFYLVPACTATIAYLLFDERLTLTQMAGMAAAIAGVVLIASRKPTQNKQSVALPE
jgi:drug/metabolite transporter (DMT)-like permease